MPPATPLRSRLARRLGRAPLPALRDVVAKQPTTGRNLDALDGVRGLAVLIVVASHTSGFQMQGHGAAGVWLFFALSAFLLTLPFAARPERVGQATAMRRYAARRLRRVLPAYYFAIAVYALITARSLPFVWQHFAFLRGAGIFWTIPQEMLFYVCLPALVALHPLVFRRRFGATIAALAAIAVAAHLWLTPEVFALRGNGRLLPFHLGIFVTGQAFAYAVHAPRLARFVARPAVNRALDAAGLVLLALLLTTAPQAFAVWRDAVPGLDALDPQPALRYGPAYGLLGGALIYVALVCEGGWTDWILSSLALRALGVVSFSLYLFHVTVQSLVGFDLLGLPHGNALFAATLAATYALACVVYSLVERPFLQLPSR